MIYYCLVSRNGDKLSELYSDPNDDRLDKLKESFKFPTYLRTYTVA